MITKLIEYNDLNRYKQYLLGQVSELIADEVKHLGDKDVNTALWSKEKYLSLHEELFKIELELARMM